MDILVIGGSYFLGRWFVQLAHKEHSITVVNRGNVPINLPGVKEIKSDRHDINTLSKFKGQHFDCAIDFCAYREGDIQIINEIFDIDRYIFISTVDVYRKGTGSIINEDSQLENIALPGDIGEYINGKVALENELLKSSNFGISVRPGIIYGPANYAPRENLYFDWIKNSGKIVNPRNATGRFQFIYVVDAAKALLKLCEIDKPEIAYNLCNSNPDTYESFNKALHEAVDMTFEEIDVDLADVIASEIPLPFPLTIEESEQYDTSRFEELLVNITPLKDGLKRAFDVFA